ncbi:MAG: tyrosine-type recombinase/integrase [Deltaproteobacteria bacterium]|nr:tyrosine-type recombinase/integrase [Deltaproteobacteria bacterium]
MKTETITHLTQDEMRSLLDAITSKRDYALFLIAYRHGLRSSEMGLLQKTDIDFERGRITIHRLKTCCIGPRTLSTSMRPAAPSQPTRSKKKHSFLTLSAFSPMASLISFIPFPLALSFSSPVGKNFVKK